MSAPYKFDAVAHRVSIRQSVLNWAPDEDEDDNEGLNMPMHTYRYLAEYGWSRPPRDGLRFEARLFAEAHRVATDHEEAADQLQADIEQMRQQIAKALLSNPRNYAGYIGEKEMYLNGNVMTQKDLDDLLAKTAPPYNFAGANLSRSNLRGANLENANLKGTCLTDASLEKANLSHANLEGAYMREANLAGATLRGANLGGASLRLAHFVEADLRGARMEKASLEKANFSHAILAAANLEGCDLSGANLRHASLKGAYLKGALCIGADFTGANIKGAWLDGVNLAGAVGIMALSLPGLISNGDTLYAVNHVSCLMVKVGFFWGTLEAFEECAQDNYRSGKQRDLYEASIRLLHIWQQNI